MVRQLHMEMDDEVFENTTPGCIWGIFHGLNYHYWQKNVKKMLPYSSTKHHQPKYSKGTARSRTRLIAYDSDESDNLLDTEASHVPVNPNTKKTRSTNKRSLKTRIKSLISEEPPKKENNRRKSSATPRKPRFQRTYSIHHLECSDYVSHESTKNDGRDHLKNQKYNENFNKSGKDHKSDKYETEEEISVDVLDIYRVNKDFFANVRNYTDEGVAKSLWNLKTREAKLTKSGSYPSPKLSQVRNFKSSKLDHKQNEVWSHSKIYKFDNTWPQVVDGTTKYSRRTLSLSDSSLDKYAQLLPRRSTEELELSSSKSLRLTNECSFKRVRSLSRPDSCDGFQIGPSSDGHSSVFFDSDYYRNVEYGRNLYKDVKRNDSNVKMEDVSNLVESTCEDDTAEISEEMKEQIVALEEKDEDIDVTEVPGNKLPNSSSLLVVQSILKQDLCPTVFPASEDLACENNSMKEESSVGSQLESCSKSLSQSSATSNQEVYDIEDENELNTVSYDDFDYISHILERSGLNGNDIFTPWSSLDQPLSPSVFHEVEVSWPHEEICLKDEFCCHHQLLFDLINELLVQIYDTSFTYYPRALSSNCRVPPMPAKFNLLEEVWSRLSKIMNSKLGLNQTVDGIVAQDMWSDDRWMNLQLESECVALELEDMFFDEFLEEIICS